MARVAVFDLDGTLLDSDEALVAPFVRLGVARSEVTFGHPLEYECTRLGIEVDEYLEAYDDQAAQPFPGVAELVAGLDRWAVCSNKQSRSGRAELARLGWEPDVAMFSDAFAGTKRLEPVLAALGVDAGEIVFVGDTAHDRQCARSVEARFVLAGWNRRAVAEEGDVVLDHPAGLPGLLG
jgi:HAD superfamily hydrolase (TIGR01549 family)